MQTEKAFMNMRRISPKEHVPFRCTGCGECCRHVHQSIPLESLDVYHIARYLREHDSDSFCTDDFIGQYAELVLLDTCGFFILMLRTTGPDDACIFLRDNRCTIHAAKPRACRIYPFVAGITPNGQYEFLLSKEKQHHLRARSPAQNVDEALFHRGGSCLSEAGFWLRSGDRTTHAHGTGIR